MPPKKQNRKKLDLTNLAGLTANFISEPEKSDEPSPSGSTPEPESPSDETVADSSPKSDLEPPVPEASTATEEEPVAVEPKETATPQELESNERRQETKKPQRPEAKSSSILSSVTNADGEVFKPGDKILAKSPWGARVVVEIKTVYQDSEGDAWAQYLPNEEQIPPGWSWLGGCSRAAQLLKA